MSAALTDRAIPQRPPMLPATLAGRSAFIIRPEPDGRWFMWNFIWGQYSGEAPMFVGCSRADAQRALQALNPQRPVVVEP